MDDSGSDDAGEGAHVGEYDRRLWRAMAELEKNKVAVGARVRTHREGHDLDRGLILSCALKDPVQLRLHDLRAANLTVEHLLVQQGPVTRRGRRTSSSCRRIRASTR